MDSTSIFIHQAPNFQYLSVCHYITILGVYFYNNDLIKLEERSQSVSVLNTLFDYINKSENQSQAKYQILKKVLKGSDLYGGGENETLDMKYVEETYQHIISTVLFSHYGNINGYLAKIINEADNVNYLAFKEMILRHLSERYITKEYCSSGNFSSRLSPLAIDKVYQEHILPIFPEPEEDISILDVSYIYAMVGLKIVNTIAAEVTNFTFQEYILISREIDLQDLNDETDQMVFKLFQIPALFYYSFNYKETFRKTYQATLTVDFWNEAYKKLFSYINSSMRQIVRNNLENSLYNKLEQQLSKLQSRTHIAATILQLYCKYESIEQVPELYISIYKTLYKWLTKLFLPNSCDFDIPDLETVYNNQFKEVEKTYNEIERNSIEKVLVDSNLLDIMDVNSTVKLGHLLLPSTMGCHLCSPIPREMNTDIYLLFTINRKNKDSNYYALRQENNVLSLLSSNGNEGNFAKAVANDSSLKMNTGLIPTTLKFKDEDYKIFVQRVADQKTKQFISGLQMYYYDETLGEKYLNFFKSLIPFYNCIESATTGRGGEAAFSCSLDVLSLIPFAGLAAKYTTKITTSLSTNIGNMFLMTNTLAKTGIITKIPLMTSLNQIAKIATRTIAKEILNRNLLKDLVVTSLRTLDPGFELFYKMSNVGVKAFRKLFQSMLSKIKNVPAVKKILSFLKSFLRNTQHNMKSFADQTGLVPMVLARREGYNIVRYFYPGGSNFFGPSCVSSLGRSAELRTIQGSSNKIPVLAITNPDNTFYKQYIPETGEILNSKLKMDKNDVLYRIGYLLDKMVLEGRSVNILRNYHVYHNTMDWKKTPTNEKPKDNLSPPPEKEKPLEILETLVSQISTRDSSAMPTRHQISNTGLQTSSKESQGVYNFPQVPESELPSTSKGKVEQKSREATPDNLLYSITLKDLLNSPISVNSLEPQTIHRSNVLIDEYPILYVHKKFDVKVQGKIKRVHNSEDSQPMPKKKEFILNEREKTTVNLLQDGNTAEKKRKIDVINEKERKLPDEYNIKDLDDIPGTSKKGIVKFDHHFYKTIIRDPTYTRYVDILMMWKTKGLPFIKQDKVNIHFLRSSINKLALLQAELDIPVKEPLKLWCSQISKGQRNIDFLRSLKGKHFFFNDITLLSKKPPSVIATDKMNPFALNTEVRYHLTFDSLYGVVDFTNFHDKLKDNYVTFNGVFFTVTDTFFSENKKILNIELQNVRMTRDFWQFSLRGKMNKLMNGLEVVKSPRVKSITNAANILIENAPLSPMRLAVDFLSDYILSIKPSASNFVPSYEMLAHDFSVMEFKYHYDNFKIRKHRHIQDVIAKDRIDQVIELSEAIRRIHEIYDSIYFRNIEEAFRKYKRIANVEKLFRFEDFYVLDSFVKNILLIDKNGLRRFEAAINRLALRQCDEQWMTNEIVLYRGEFITKELSESLLKSLYRENLVSFDTFKKFSPERDVEIVKFLNNHGAGSQVPLLTEITVSNRAGVADLSRALHEDVPFHVVTANLEFTLDEIYHKDILGQRVLIMKMRDYQNPTERRMITMAERLHELFSTDTKYYTDFVPNEKYEY